MLKHPHAEGFKRAAHTEIAALQAERIWTEVPFGNASEAEKTPIPTTWVFKYKFDDQGYLTKHKARLCARGDIKHAEQDTIAATLAARIFRALMAIVTAFDLEPRQYDAANAFANSPIDEPTYCKPPAGWTGFDTIYCSFGRCTDLSNRLRFGIVISHRSSLELGFKPVLWCGLPDYKRFHASVLLCQRHCRSF